MATELNFSVSVTYNKSGVNTARAVLASAEDLTGAGTVQAIKLVGFAAAEALALGGVTTPGGVAWFKNLNATNFVQIGFDDTGFVPIAKLLPGECALIPLVNAPWAQADTGACLLEYQIFDR